MINVVLVVIAAFLLIVLSIGVTPIFFVVKSLLKNNGKAKDQSSPKPTGGATTPSSATTTTSKKESKSRRGIKTILVWGIILCTLFWFGTKVLQPHTIASPSSIWSFLVPKSAHPNFHRRLCDPYAVHDLTNDDPTKPIHIPLQEGCYGDVWKFPGKVQQYEIQKSTNPGDYASLWCNDHPDPTLIVEYYTDGMGGLITDGCRGRDDRSNTFRAQGHGELIFFPTVENH